MFYPSENVEWNVWNIQQQLYQTQTGSWSSHLQNISIVIIVVNIWKSTCIFHYLKGTSMKIQKRFPFQSTIQYAVSNQEPRFNVHSDRPYKSNVKKNNNSLNYWMFQKNYANLWINIQLFILNKSLYHFFTVLTKINITHVV